MKCLNPFWGLYMTHFNNRKGNLQISFMSLEDVELFSKLIVKKVDKNSKRITLDRYISLHMWPGCMVYLKLNDFTNLKRILNVA